MTTHVYLQTFGCQMDGILQTAAAPLVWTREAAAASSDKQKIIFILKKVILACTIFPRG